LKADIFAGIFLWNKNVDSLVRVLQRMEVLGIWSRQETTAYEVRLEEFRATVNADFAELIFCERAFRAASPSEPAIGNGTG
jgi:hypothetical protein